VIEGGEFLVILLVALMVVGPERLPVLARKLGGWAADLRRAARDLREGLEAEVGDVRQIADDLKKPLREIEDTVRSTQKVINEDVAPKTWVGPKPVSGPTPEDAMRDLEEINATGAPLTEPETAPAEPRASGAWIGPRPLPPDPDGEQAEAGGAPRGPWVGLRPLPPEPESTEGGAA